MEIIEGKLNVHNRKKADICQDLHTRNYAAFGKEVAIEEGGEPQGAYDYLLSMPIYSLTRERVELLQKERQEKETELNRLLAQTPKDLWRADLDAFEQGWRERMNKLDAIIASALAKGAAANKKKAPVRRKGEEEEEEEGEEDFDAEEAEVMPVKKDRKAAAPRKTVASTEALAAVLPKKTANNEVMSKPASQAPSKPAPTLDAFVKKAPVFEPLNSEEELALPLAERIQRMLAAKNNSEQVVKEAPLLVKPQAVKPSKPAAKPVKPARKKQIISSEEDEEDVYQISD